MRKQILKLSMKLTINQALQRAIAAHKKGNLQESERLYKTILQSQPAHADANHNLGLIAVSFDKVELALPLFKIALETNPKVEQFWLSYIEALIKENKLETAKAALQQGRKVGLVGEKVDVLQSRLKQIRLPTLPKSSKTGNSLTIKNKSKKISESKQQKKQAKNKNANRLNPSKSELNTLLEHYQNQQYTEAEKLAITITQQFPEHQFGWKVLGTVLQQTGRFLESLDAKQRAVELSPQDAEAHSNLGNSFTDLGILDKAESSYRQAIVIKSDYVEAHCNLGTTLQKLGRLEEAEAKYRQAIELKPDLAEAHRLFSLMKKFDRQDEQFLQMQTLSLQESRSEEERCHLSFALAKAFEDLGDFEQSFKCYSKGNSLRKKLLNYDISQDVKIFKQLKYGYTKIEKKALVSDNLPNKPAPIFILGMPRSGTTLVEQIVSSHSHVTGAGELSFVAQFGGSIARGLSEVNTKALLNFRQNYLEKLQIHSNGSPMVIDKMPHNFYYIGLIAAAFPDARIVHIKRNAAAVCWGNYKQYFSSTFHGYCHELDDVVAYYALYQNLMEFWETMLPKRIYNLDYELLTTNQEDETKKLIQHLGLDWENECLKPQDNKRTIATASAAQVRQKVYQGSSQQWKKFKPFLNGALNYLDEYPKGHTHYRP